MKPQIYSLLRKNIISIIILCLIYSNNCLSQKAELRIPIGHYGQITDLQESPDGKLLASASADGTIKIWQKNTGILLKTLDAHTEVVTSIDFSPDGKTIISGSNDKTVRLWDVLTGQLSTILGRHDGEVQFVAFSPDGKYALSFANENHDFFRKYRNQDIRNIHHEITDTPIKVWNISKAAIEPRLKKHPYTIKILQFLPNNDTTKINPDYVQGGVIYGKKYKTCLMTVTKNILEELTTKGDIKSDQITKNYRVIYLPDQSEYITQNVDDGIERWNVKDNSFKGKVSLDSLLLGLDFDNKDIPEKLIDVLISSFNISINKRYSYIASAQKVILIDKINKKARVVETVTSEKKSYYAGNIESLESIVMQLVQTSIGVPGFITVLRPDDYGNFFLGLSNGSILSYTQNGTNKNEFIGDSQKNVSAVAWDENEHTILTGHWDNFLKKYNYLNSTLSVLYKYKSTINTIKSTAIYDFASSGDLMRFDDENDKKHSIWGINNILFEKNKLKTVIFNSFTEGIGDSSSVCCNSQLSNTGQYIAIYRRIDESGGIYLYNVEKQNIYKIFDSPKFDFSDEKVLPFLGFRMLSGKFTLNDIMPGANSIAFTQNDSLVAAITNGNTRIGVWNIKTGNLNDIDTKQFGVKAVDFSPNNKSLGYGGIDKTLSIYNLESSKKQNLSGHNGTIYCVKYSNKGKYLASCGEDKLIIIRDGNTGDKLRTLKGHQGTVNTLDFTKDERFLLSGSDDQTTKIWDVEKGEELATYITVDSTDWVITCPEGYFDASEGAMKKIYFVQGLEVFTLEQLKERFWHPSLLNDLLTCGKGCLQKSLFDYTIPLPPTVNLSVKGESLTIDLQARNGGVGKVSLFLNGREIVEDLRKNGKDDADKKALGYRFNMSSPFIKGFLEPDIPNIFKVIAYERNDEISTSGDTISFVSQKLKAKSGIGIETGNKSTPKEEAKIKNMSFYAIVIGANTLGLRYADTDARAFKSVLENTAKQFIDTTKGNKIDIRLFCSSQTNAALRPTRENILNYLRFLTTIAKKEDYFCFYFSGHGKVFESISKSSKTAKTDFAMLLQGVNSATKLDKNLSEYVRQNLVITMRDELVPLLNAIPARKQVHCVDACGSEQAALLATNGEKDILLSKEKAFDNMKSRTGRYFLASSAKDKVSYENSTFQHGFMTYTLLQGLNSDRTIKYFGKEAYLDVASWFKYAESETPKLAASVGQVQIPKFWTPSQQNEDIFLGIVNDELRKQISLPTNSMIQFSGYSNFQQLNSEDPLNLSDKFKGYLREKSELDPSIFMYDENPSINSYALRGTYRKENEKIIFENIGLFKNKTRVKELGRIEKQNVDELIKELFETLIQSIK